MCQTTQVVASTATATAITTTDTNNGSVRLLLPPVEDWPHRPVFVKASDETKILGRDENEALPLGVPFEFETPLFKGQMLLRLRNATSDEIESHGAYFSGRKRLMQTVVQGRFKKPMGMDEVYMGSLFSEPLRLVPPPSMARMIQAMISSVAPGVVMDLASEKPRVVTLYAGTTQSLSVDKPGTEPDIMAVDLPENTSILGRIFKTSKHRKNYLSIPKKAAQHQFDTEHVYTFHHYDHAMDYAKYTMKLPFYDYDLSKAIGPQPMGLSAVTSSGEIIFHFDVWHENVYKM
eukprot:CAMPEP_0170205210 /NCGR_PEP_ID=MMETSP0116_2-20130129/2144_1 /TAXON_ID=400756 /ORGANISM="Durinskia baltica, Strain CSIRO CS-38" /LENGTH=289 /DNA_ID=CAMNT_0010455591 /DNA_START=105 /DNA_END=971 /DNA_ORIENTATION=-